MDVLSYDDGGGSSAFRQRGRGWDDESGILLHFTTPALDYIVPTHPHTPRPLFFSTYADYYLINSVYYDCYLYARYFHGESYAYGRFPKIPLACSLAILIIFSPERERCYQLNRHLSCKNHYLSGNRGHRSRFDVLYDFAKSIIRNLVHYASVQST